MKIYQHLLSITALLFLTACTTTSTTISDTWKAPNFTGNSLNTILVLGVSDNESNRKMFEDSMVKALNTAGTHAVASYTVLSTSQKLSKTAITAAVKKQGYNGIIISRFVTVKSNSHYVKGDSYVVPNGAYSMGYPSGFYDAGYNGFYRSGYYGYYQNSYSVVHEPDYMVTTKSIVLETNLYSVKSNMLIWSGRSTTVNPESASKVIPSVTTAISKELLKEGVI